MTATDNGTPRLSKNTAVRIDVIRSHFPPRFEKSVYSPHTISESEKNGTGIYNVKATDEDILGEIVYELVGIPPALEFFAMDSEEGNIWLIQSLKADIRIQTFTVSILLPFVYMDILLPLLVHTKHIF